MLIHLVRPNYFLAETFLVQSRWVWLSKFRIVAYLLQVVLSSSTVAWMVRLAILIPMVVQGCAHLELTPRPMARRATTSRAARLRGPRGHEDALHSRLYGAYR
jgi:hypothetical protein